MPSIIQPETCTVFTYLEQERKKVHKYRNSENQKAGEEKNASILNSSISLDAQKRKYMHELRQR